MTIRFVYFDLGNILFSFERHRASQNLASLLDVDFDDAERVLHAEGLQEELEHGRLSLSQYAGEVCHRLGHTSWPDQNGGLRGATPKIADAISDMFTPINEMASVVRATRRTVGRIGILSNTCDAHWDWIRRMNSPIMKETFDELILSCRVNSMKPDEQIYRIAQTEAGCDAAEILFIDDREENVDMARQLGWNAEVCLGGPSVIDALRRHGAISSDVTFLGSAG